MMLKHLRHLHHALISASPRRPRTPLSVPAESPLKGLNVFKAGSDPLARQDDDYPDWLWELVEAREGVEGEVEAKTRLRRANREKIKTTNFMKTT